MAVNDSYCVYSNETLPAHPSKLRVWPQLSSCSEVTAVMFMLQGAGLVWPLGSMGSLEVNYCRILASQDTDRAKHGLQLGFVPSIH